VLIALWCVGLAAGAHALWRYSSTPGRAVEAPIQWPANAAISRQAGHPTLVMMAHPQCPCTRASLAELERLLARAPIADVWVLFLRPEGAQPGWEKTLLWDAAAAIPGVRVAADAEGTAAHAFGAETSGHVLFYDASGALRFSGGITAARGHEGPSAGGDALLAALQGAPSASAQARTFGCPLLSPTTAR
jgi:hypothetical protein